MRWPLPCLRYLEERQVQLQERLVEWAGGIRVGGADAPKGSGAALTPADIARREQASNLVCVPRCGANMLLVVPHSRLLVPVSSRRYLGDPMFSIDLCVQGLKMFNDDADRVAEWLLSGEARMFEQGGGLDEKDDDESARYKEGRTLAQIVGMPPALCYLALQLFKDNKDASMNLLFDQGGM